MNTNIILKTALVLGMTLFAASCEKKEISSEREDGPAKHEVSSREAMEQKSAKVADKKSEKMAKVEPSKKEVKQRTKVAIANLPPVARPKKSVGKTEDAADDKLYEIVTDPSTIEVVGGGVGPEVGEKIYSYAGIPKDACGTYWVRMSDGRVGEFVVCPKVQK